MRLSILGLFVGCALFVIEATTSAQTGSKSKDTPKTTVEAPKVAGKTFEQWLKELSHKDPSKRETAIRAVCTFPPATAVKALPYLVFELRKHNSSTPVDLSVRCNLSTALGELLSSQEKIEPKVLNEAVNLLRFQLRDPQEILRFRAASALGSIGPDAKAALPDLMIMLRDHVTWEARQAAATALGAIALDGTNGPPPQVLKGLYDLLYDPAYQVRLAAVQSLSVLGPPPDKDAIENFAQALLPVALKDPEPGLQIWARVAIIGATKDFSKTNITPIVKFLSNEDPGLRLQAVQALGAMQAKVATAGLIACLSDTDPSVQASAVWAVGRLETAAIDALPILEKLAADPNSSDYLKRTAKDSIKKVKGGE